jgi:L-histidine Nalpha-methyltransferase
MTILMPRERFTMIASDGEVDRAAFAREVEAGLTGHPKRLPCRYFYDEEGSQLFEAICDLPEYYLTRTERAILQANAREIAALFPPETALVEMGSGSAAKTRLLIEAFLARNGVLRYIPIDISRSMLEESSVALLADYPGLEVHAIAAEYRQGLCQLRAEETCPKLILWLGSNIGNFERVEASGFLRQIGERISPSDRLLVGVDLRKGADVLEPAYDDAAGVTARFNRNILARINRELGARFDLDQFVHRAVYDADKGRVEMHLVSRRDQRVPVAALSREIAFAAGETIHTENSYKYSIDEIDAVAFAAGLAVERRWLDPERRFSVNLMRPAYCSE